MKFSIALIAKNESKTLPRLMESLSEFISKGGKVVLLDTGSTDGTPDVARHLGCEVHEVGDRFKIKIDSDLAKKINAHFGAPEDQPIVSEGSSIFDYASARNYIAEFSPTDFIATPDCDEVWTKFDLDAINKAIEDGADQLEYSFVYAHNPDGSEAIKFNHSKFYNRTKLKWVGVIHEVLKSDVPVNRVELPETIIKLEHWQNVETNRSHYLTGLAYDCYLNPNNDRNVHYFARELFYYGRFDLALKQFEHHLTLGGWPTERASSLCIMGEIYLAMGNKDEAFKHFWMSFDLEPNRREPLMKMAEYYYKKKQPDQLIAVLNAILTIKGGDFYANYQPYYENIPHEMMYWALWIKEEIAASKSHFDICLAYQPFNPKYLHDFRFYYDLPAISFILPTIRQNGGLEKCIQSIKSLNYPENRMEIVLIANKNEKGDLAQSIADKDPMIKIVRVDDNFTVPQKVKAGVEVSEGTWYAFASDDMEFEPNSIMCALKTASDNAKKFMAFNSGPVSPDEGNICEHFIIHKDLVAKIGDIFDTDFYHVGVDNYLWAQMKKLNQNMRCARAKVNHHHFSANAERPATEMDEVSKSIWTEENVKHDRDLLEKKLQALHNPPAVPEQTK